MFPRECQRHHVLVCENSLCRTFDTQNDRFYQDRLGTNRDTFSRGCFLRYNDETYGYGAKNRLFCALLLNSILKSDHFSRQARDKDRES